jgi:hypothetical protein
VLQITVDQFQPRYQCFWVPYLQKRSDVLTQCLNQQDRFTLKSL